LTHPRIAYLVLAAGASQRFRDCKQLARLDSKKTMLEHVLDALLEISPEGVYLVLGAHREKIQSTLEINRLYPPVRTLYNDCWPEGIASSISHAVHHVLDDAFKGVMILLADQVAITSDHLNQLQEVWFKQTDKIVCADYQDTLGAPAIFPRRYFKHLIRLRGDRGAKWLINQEKANVVAFSLPQAQWDIDTERQLHDWQIRTRCLPTTLI